MDPPYLREINTKSVHVQPIQKTRKALAESRQALVHQLEVHHIGLQVGHGVGKLRKGGLESIQRERGSIAVHAVTGGVAQRGAGRGSEGCCWARARGRTLAAVRRFVVIHWSIRLLRYALELCHGFLPFDAKDY